MFDKIWKMTACDVVDDLKKNKLSPEEVLDDLLLRYRQVNHLTNSMPTLCIERALTKLKRTNFSKKKPLFGLPIPIKDSSLVSGVRSTIGSLAFKDFIPQSSDFIVKKIQDSGGIVYGKTNTPEFEAGASTFNDVFGITRNPWNLEKSVSGSSGGAASSVATGMAFLAQGSDFACSIRYPSSFCGVVGLRPTPGLIPYGPNNLPSQTLSVMGPIARNTQDVGLGLDAMSGFNILDPLTFPNVKKNYRRAAEEPLKMTNRIAFSFDLGLGPISNNVKKIFLNALNKLEKNKIDFIEESPDLIGASETFKTLRAYQFYALWNKVLKNNRDNLKPEVVWNIEQGSKISSSKLFEAEKKRYIMRKGMISFLDKYEFFVTPTSPVEPFQAEERYVKEINNINLESYIDWLFLGFSISLVGCPSISIPCGFTKDNLPIGMQIISKPYNEYRLLSFASWIEKNLDFSLIEPISPK